MKVFTLLLQPLANILATTSTKIDKESLSKKLFFNDFVNKLLFGIIYQCDSLRNLSLELSSNEICKDLGLSPTPFSTLKDGFSRFDSRHFKVIFEEVLTHLPIYKVPFLSEWGIFSVIDGSLFPTLLQMDWTKYKTKSNAFKMHMSFELNRMIPTEFLIKSGNSCERTNMITMLRSGVTYIADRGYFSFDLAQKIVEKTAFFILRLKENMVFTSENELFIDKINMPACFKNLTDKKGYFTNDPHKTALRIIEFQVWDSTFSITTNRFDLSTLQIIILYAYRWQIELFFKYIKRTLKSIHLMNHTENGVQIQFYLTMTLAILELNLKQTCQNLQNISTFFQQIDIKSKEVLDFKGLSPSNWIKNIAQPFYIFWKISKNWLIILKNSMTQVLDNQIIKKIAFT